MKVNVNKLVSAALTLLLGILLIVLKGGVIKIALTILGIALIVLAVLDLLNKQLVPCVVKGVIGIAVIALGWALIKFAHIVLAVALIAYGVLQLYELLSGKTKKKKDSLKLFLQFATPIASVIAGVFLFIDAGWVYNIAGVFLLINGILALIEALKK